MNLQRLVDETRKFGFLVRQDARQGDVALEIADFDDHLITFLGHQHFIHLDVWQWQTQDVGVALAGDFLDGAAIEDLCRVQFAKDGIR